VVGADDTITPPAAVVAKATIVNPDGIHARPAALIVEALASLDAGHDLHQSLVTDLCAQSDRLDVTGYPAR
jgi:hypothetical protein